MRKGVLAFNVLTSVAYRAALGVDEAWAGAMLLVPSALDTYRYYRPNRAGQSGPRAA